MSDFLLDVRGRAETLGLPASSAKHPRLAAGAGLVCAVWQSFDPEAGSDRVGVAINRDGAWSEPAFVGTGAFRPRVAVDPAGTAWIVWSVPGQRGGGAAAFVAARHADGRLEPPTRLMDGVAPTAWPDVAVDPSGRVWVAWVDRRGLSVMAREDAGWSVPQLAVEGDRLYRPALALGPNGIVHVAFDRFVGGRYDVFATSGRDGAWEQPERLSTADGWAANVALASDAGGALWASWHTIGDRADIACYVASCSVPEGRWAAPRQVVRRRAFTAGCSIAVSPEGTPVIVYSWGRSVHARLPGAPSDGPAVLARSTSAADEFHRRGVATFDGSGGVWLAWQSSPGNGHWPRLARIRCVRRTVGDLLADADPAAERDRDAFVERPYERFETAQRRHVVATRPPDSEDPGYGSYRLYWGDIHGQTGMSDGLGEVDQYYAVAQGRAALDFTALTDHDSFPDPLGASEWEHLKEEATRFHAPPHFVTLPGFEWTSNEFEVDHGHKCVYYPTADPPLWRCTDPRSDEPAELADRLSEDGALAIPHHPAADWGVVSAATDWSWEDHRVQRLVEIASIHGVFESFGSASPYTKNVPQVEGHSVRDALARGQRLGILGGSDTHQLEPGLEGGLTAVYATDLTRGGIFAALRDRRTYATTGARIGLAFWIDGAIMGQQLVRRVGAVLRLRVRARGTAPLREITLVKNGVEYARFDLSGQQDAETISDDLVVGAAVAYYYVRVAQADDHMAWSSPIWVSGS